MPRFGGQSLFVRERNIGIPVGSLARCGRSIKGSQFSAEFGPKSESRRLSRVVNGSLGEPSLGNATDHLRALGGGVNCILLSEICAYII